jgi:hypothetical protein
MKSGAMKEKDEIVGDVPVVSACMGIECVEDKDTMPRASGDPS